MRHIVYTARDFIRLYDPGHFNLIYSIKSVVAVIISISISYPLLGQDLMVWAGITPLQVFFLNATISVRTNKRLYIFLFAVLSSLSIGVFYNLSLSALSGGTLNMLCLVMALIFLSFCVGMCKAYDPELYKMAISVLINSLVECLYVESGKHIGALPQMYAILIGSSVAFVIAFLLLDNSHSYGKYTRVYFPMLLTSTMNMVRNIDKTGRYDVHCKRSLSMIDEIKHTLCKKTGHSKNSFIVKNTKRAMFYAYKVEDICLSINILHAHLLSNPNKPLQTEIISNLNQLKRIFAGKPPNLKYVEYDKVMSDGSGSVNIAFTNAVKMLYSKMHAFWRVGDQADVTFVSRPRKGFKDFIKTFSTKNETCRFSVKYSLAIGLSYYFASLFHVSKGVWISLGIVAVIKPSLGEIGNIGREYFIGAGVGIVTGICIASLTSGFLFYFLFLIVIFLIAYSRSFTYGLWAGCLMCGSAMMYSLVYSDFITQALDRLLYIGVGIAFAILLFRLIWPAYSQDGFLPLLSSQNVRLENILDLLVHSQMDANGIVCQSDLQNIQTEFYRNLDEMRQIMSDSMNERKKADGALLKAGRDIISVLDSMSTRSGELIQFCHDLCKQNERSELYGHDIRIIHTRMHMINKLISSEAHFFDKAIGDRFLGNDSDYFMWMITDLFELQNRLYDILNANLHHG